MRIARPAYLSLDMEPAHQVLLAGLFDDFEREFCELTGRAIVSALSSICAFDTEQTIPLDLVLEIYPPAGVALSAAPRTARQRANVMVNMQLGVALHRFAELLAKAADACHRRESEVAAAHMIFAAREVGTVAQISRDVRIFGLDVSMAKIEQLKLAGARGGQKGARSKKVQADQGRKLDGRPVLPSGAQLTQESADLVANNGKEWRETAAILARVYGCTPARIRQLRNGAQKSEN